MLHRVIDHGQQLADAAVDRVRAANPGLTVDGWLECGRVAEVLLDLASGADEVVLGACGTGRFYRLRLGSVAAQLAAHVLCPVTVVRGEVGRTGVDGSESGRAALDYGFAYADRHGMAVQPLHAFPLPVPMPRLAYPSTTVAQIRESALQLVTDIVRPWIAKYPHVPVEPTVAPGHPAGVLADVSRESTLVVIGTRGRGGFAEVLLGSVGQAVLRQSHCPVTIAR